MMRWPLCTMPEAGDTEASTSSRAAVVFMLSTSRFGSRYLLRLQRAITSRGNCTVSACMICS